jgi:hypothetical protein
MLPVVDCAVAVAARHSRARPIPRTLRLEYTGASTGRDRTAGRQLDVERR